MRFVGMALLTVSASCHAELCELTTLWAHIQQDYARAYDTPALTHLGVWLLGSGVLANTGLDRSFQKTWQQDVRTSFWNHTLHLPNQIGGLRQWTNMLPIYTGLYILVGCQTQSEWTTLGDWGGRSLRTVLVGAPQQAILTHALGAHRPEQNKSHWTPFKGHRAISGHAFYGAVPFVNAAKIAVDWRWKVAWYTASTLPALARVNQNKHYTSQALAGWSIAFVAATVMDTPSEWSMSPTFSGEGIQWQWRF